MRITAVVALGAMSLLACTDIIPSAREEAYEYRRFVGTQAVSIRWTEDQMPLRIYVDPASPLVEHLRTAIDRWEKALLYGEFRGIIVSDSTDADILLYDASPDEVNPKLRLSASAPQCSGDTDFDFDLTTFEMYLPVRMYVYPNGSQSGPALETCLRLTTTHELGHALGILQHSLNTADVMFTNPVLDGVSLADKQTMEQVFHSQSTLSIVRNQ